MKKIKFDIIKRLGVISDDKFEIQFNYVSWNGESLKYEIRRWSKDGLKPMKGFSFSELQNIKKAIKNIKYDYFTQKVIKEITNEQFTCKFYDILETLSESEQWIRIISIVDWNFGMRLDLRAWSTDYKSVGKGILITFKQAEEFLTLLNNMTSSKNDEVENEDIDSSLFI